MNYFDILSETISTRSFEKNTTFSRWTVQRDFVAIDSEKLKKERDEEKKNVDKLCVEK